MLFLNDWDHQVSGAIPLTWFMADVRRLLMSYTSPQRARGPLLLTTVSSMAPTPTTMAATATTHPSRPGPHTEFDS
jgi:hypothetical protein